MKIDSMKIYPILAVVMIAFIVAGCASIPSQPTMKDLVPGKTPVKDAMTPAKDTPAATPKVCTEAINYQVLIDAMPKGSNGYVADTPSGNMLTFTNPADQSVMKYSTASVNLVNSDKNIEITAMDTCYIQYLSLAWAGFYESEGTDGYFKKTTISSYPAWHQYTKSSETYSYNVFVGDRVIVTVQGGDGVSDSDVSAVANAVDYASIAAAAK